MKLNSVLTSTEIYKRNFHIQKKNFEKFIKDMEYNL